MKIKIILAVIAITAVVATAQTKDDLAASVIRSEVYTGYNLLNNSEEEQNKAASINASLRLQHILLYETTNDELRVCYALHILDSQVKEARQLADAHEFTSTSSDAEKTRRYLANLLEKQKELAKQFREIQKAKSRPVVLPSIAEPNPK
jgi:hypothetical protein